MLKIQIRHVLKDSNAIEAYVNGTQFQISREMMDIWMLHGDVGEDNNFRSLYGGDKENAKK